MTSYIYVDSKTSRFALISDRPLSDDSLNLVESLPPDAQHRWDGQRWIALTEEEIQEGAEPVSPEENLGQTIERSMTTAINSFALWGDSYGGSLTDSMLVLNRNQYILNSRYDLNLEGKDISIDGKSITKKIKQKAIANSRVSYSSSSWADIPGMVIKTENTSPTKFKFSAELFLQVSKNYRELEVGLFINGSQQTIDTLSVSFGRSRDDKSVSWSNDDYYWQPNTEVKLRWRRTGSSVTCYCERRKLLLEEI